jgi:hypothetical protein
MLRQLLDPAKWDMEIMSAKAVTSEVLFEAQETLPSVICVAALPPGGLARTRYLCKRLRAKMQDAKLLIGRWGLNENVKADEAQLTDAGADQVATSLRQTLEFLNVWRPVLEEQTADADTLERAHATAGSKANHV